MRFLCCIAKIFVDTCAYSAADGVSGSVMKPQFTMMARSTMTLNSVHARTHREREERSELWKTALRITSPEKVAAEYNKYFPINT